MKAFVICATIAVVVVGLADANNVEECFNQLNSKVSSMEVPDVLAQFQQHVSMEGKKDRVELEEALQAATMKAELRAATRAADKTCKEFAINFEEAKYSTSCHLDIDEYMGLYEDNVSKRAEYLPKYPQLAKLNEAFEFCSSIQVKKAILDFDPETDLHKVKPIWKRVHVSI